MSGDSRPPHALPCSPCVPRLSSLPDRVAALRGAIAAEPEPLVTLTHLLQLCRDEHAMLWERVNDPACRARVTAILAGLPTLPRPSVVPSPVRRALAAALEPVDDVPAVVIARALAQFVDTEYGHTFTESFRRRSPYQPGVGDPIPLDHPNLPKVIAMPATSPPWRLANRLDETRRIRLAGEWAAQFRVVFDYSLADTLPGLVTASTRVATCHPNRTLAEFGLPHDVRQPDFPVRPLDLERQRRDIDTLIARAAARASIVVLPELCVTEGLAEHLQEWVRRPEGPRLLVAGSYHHEDESAGQPRRRRNTAIAWVRGHDRPLIHDKHSPADRPVLEDIQPQGWPELRIYVTNDGWHLVIAICRDLLNPHAVHALAEAGANLVLVPAMSETLVPFGGPAAHLVGSCQALVAVANNPAEWSDAGDLITRGPARALFGHPGFGQQTRFVQPPDTDPGVALLTVGSGQLEWLTSTRSRHTENDPRNSAALAATEPGWVGHLARHTRHTAANTGAAQVILRQAAVLVLLTDGPAGPQVLLTERAADLAHYPGQLVFPGGAVESRDSGPIAAALREAAEEVGLAPDTVEIIGALPPLGLLDSGFLVTPVLAWSARPAFPASSNLAEVANVLSLPLHEPAGALRPDIAPLGRMTATVIDLLRGMLARPPDTAPAERGAGAPCGPRTAGVTGQQ